MTPRRLRVAHVAPAPEFASLILVHDLRRLRDRCDALVICSDGPALDPVRAEGFRIHVLSIQRKMAPWKDLAALVQLVRVLRAERPDIVHGYTPKGGLLATIAGWVARVPVRVYGCRGLLYAPGTPAAWRAVFRCVDRVTNAAATRTFFVSRGDMEFCTSNGLCPPHRARHTGSGIDLRWYDPAAVDDADVGAERAALGVPAEGPLILTVGRFVAAKGYRELAEAGRRVLEAHPRARFIWVAPRMTGEDVDLPDTLAEQAGLSGAVTRLPHRDDLRALYRAADLLVHASHREGVPRVLIEAAAMGTPIVATDIPGSREVVANGVTALLVPVGNAGALADAMLAALADPAATAERARRAHAHVRRNLDADLVATRVLREYEGALLRPRAD